MFKYAVSNEDGSIQIIRHNPEAPREDYEAFYYWDLSPRWHSQVYGLDNKQTNREEYWLNHMRKQERTVWFDNLLPLIDWIAIGYPKQGEQMILAISKII